NQAFPIYRSWLISPLAAQVPSEITANITNLKEAMLDEGALLGEEERRAHAFAALICDRLLANFTQKGVAQARAGLQVAQATGGEKLSEQALEARRNYLMSWPQYLRENQQRNVLMTYRNDAAAVKGKELEVEWQEDMTKESQILSKQYSAYRSELRKFATPQ